MPKLAYTVRITCPTPDHAAHICVWLEGGHIAEVIAGGAEAADLVRMEEDPCIIEVRYRFPDADVFARYESEHAPRLREDGKRQFPPDVGFVYERSVGTVTSFA